MSTVLSFFLNQNLCSPMALNTIFPSERTPINTLYPIEGSFDEFLKKKLRKGKKVYRALEGLRKSKSSAPISSTHKKKPLPPIKLYDPLHSKKHSSPYVISKNHQMPHLVNFHRKLLQFNQKRISKENKKQLIEFKNYFTNACVNDDDCYSSIGSINASPIITKQSIKDSNCYSVLRSNKWDISLQDFLHNKFEKTKQLFYLNQKEKHKTDDTPNQSQEVSKAKQNKTANKSQANLFKGKLHEVYTTPKNKPVSFSNDFDKWKKSYQTRS